MAVFGFSSHEKQLRALSERVEALEKERKTLVLEWDLAWEKLRSLMGRLSKRAELDQARTEPEGEATGADGQPLALSPRQLTIHNQVLRRRRLLS